MSNYVEKRAEQLSATGFDFKFGDYISKGFSLFSGQAMGYILFTLLFFVLMMVGSGLVFVVSFIPGSQLLMGIVTSVIYCLYKVGCYNAAYHADHQLPYNFSNFFKGFDNFGKLIVPALILSVLAAIPNIPNMFGPNVFDVYRQMMVDPDNAMEQLEYLSTQSNPMLSTLSFLLWIPVAVLLAMWHWTIPLVFFHNMEYQAAMNISRQLVSKNLMMITIFLIVVYLLGWLGIILCCVGVFATLPAMMNAQYAAFADVIGFKDEQGTDDVIDHLV